MSRPKSIVLFDRLYLLSIVVSVIGVVLAWGKMNEAAMGSPEMAANPEMAAIVMPIIIFTLVVSYGITLLLWWLVAYKANDVVKWIFVVLNGLGILMALFSLIVPNAEGVAGMIIKLVAWALAAASLYFLFRPDARAWFANKGQGNPEDPFA